MKRTVGFVIGSVLFSISLTACGEDPCTRLPAPTLQEVDIANSGAEVEREVNGVECELENGIWVRDSSSSSSVRKNTTSKSVPYATAAPKTTPKKSTTTKRHP